MKKKCGLLRNTRCTNVCVCIIWQSHWIKYQACPHFIPFFFCSLRSLVAEFLRKTYIKRLSRLHWIISQIWTREMERQSEKNWDFFLSIIYIFSIFVYLTNAWRVNYLMIVSFEIWKKTPPSASTVSLRVSHAHIMRRNEREKESAKIQQNSAVLMKN